MYVLNVSGLNNNSGLYALALAASLAIEENETNIDKIPNFVRRISCADVAPADEPTAKQINLGQLLRINLSLALKDDLEFQNKALRDFIKLCLHIHKKLPANMEAFAKSNDKFISDLNIEIQKMSFNPNTIYKLSGVPVDVETYAYIQVKKNWDKIYNNYTDYVATSDVELSANELNCLASKWNVKLPIPSQGTKISKNLLIPGVSFAISKESGEHWQVLANDSTLKPVSAEDDDQFKTLCLLDEALREILIDAPSAWDPSESGNSDALRNTHLTYINKAKELVLKPKNARASMSFNDVVDSKDFQEVEVIEQDLNSILWSFKHPQKLYATTTKANLGVGLGFGAALEGGSAIAGLCGATESMVFSSAFNLGRAARVGEAVNIGSTILRASNIIILASAISFELAMLSRRKFNEFGDSIGQALKLYKEALEEPDNTDKLLQVDEILRSELGIGTNNRWGVTRSVIWTQAKITEKIWKGSDDQYALIYYILADIGSKLNRGDMQEFFSNGYSSNDNKIKSLSLLGLTKLIANAPGDPENSEETITTTTNTIKTNMALLKDLNPQLIAGCFNDVQNALAYSLWILKTQQVEDALHNIEKILQNDNLKVLPYMQPHGELCAAVITFIQGICLQLKCIVVSEENLNKFQDSNKSAKSLCKLEKEFHGNAIDKFKDCCAIMLDINENLSSIDDKCKFAMIREMRGYCRRFFDDSVRKGRIREDVAELITKFNLEDQFESEEDEDDRMMQRMRALTMRS